MDCLVSCKLEDYMQYSSVFPNLVSGALGLEFKWGHLKCQVIDVDKNIL